MMESTNFEKVRRLTATLLLPVSAFVLNACADNDAKGVEPRHVSVVTTEGDTNFSIAGDYCIESGPMDNVLRRMLPGETCGDEVYEPKVSEEGTTFAEAGDYCIESGPMDNVVRKMTPGEVCGAVPGEIGSSAPSGLYCAEVGPEDVMFIAPIPGEQC